MSLVKDLRKVFGDDSVFDFSDAVKAFEIETMSTGSLLLNKAIGGGYPVGRVVEIFGAESSGKTTLCLHAIAEAQKLGKTCGLIDMEYSFDPEYAKNLGVQTDKSLLISQPKHAEEALEMVIRMVEGGVGLVIVDSVAALIPRAEVEGDMGDSHMGLQARLMSQAMRKLTSIIGQYKSIVIFTNQLRSKIGASWGSPWVTTGGNALKYYASVRLEVVKKASDKVMGESEDQIAHKVIVSVVKNKIAAPYKKAELWLYYGKGFDRLTELLEVGIQSGLVVQGGGWYTFDGGERIKGKEAAKEYLDKTVEIKEKIQKTIG